MQKKFWFPGKMPERISFFQNFGVKIAKYQDVLGFSPEQIAEMEQVSADYIAAYSWVYSCEASMRAAYAWRDELYGEPAEVAASPPAPVFPDPPVIGSPRGLIERMYRFRRQIVSRDGYTADIGADLGLIGSTLTRSDLAEMAPNLNISTAEGNQLLIKGNMWKMPAVIIEYRPENGEWKNAAILTNLPASVNITTTDAEGPERGLVRAIYYGNNVTQGTYSPEYPVVIF